MMHHDMISEKETTKHEIISEVPSKPPSGLASPSANSEVIRSADLLKWEEVIRTTEPWRGPPLTMETGFSWRNLVIERMRDHSIGRSFLLASALLNLMSSCVVSYYGYYETHPVEIAKPGVVGNVVMILLQQVFSLVLMCKLMWAVGIIMVTLECEYKTLRRIVFKSASLTIIIVGLAFFFTYFAGYMYGEELDGYMLRFYIQYLSMELIVPALMNVLPVA